MTKYIRNLTFKIVSFILIKTRIYRKFKFPLSGKDMLNDPDKEPEKEIEDYDTD